MKIILLIIFFLINSGCLIAQQIPQATEQQLEEIITREEDGAIDEEIINRLEDLKKNKLDINLASASELIGLGLLSTKQISSLVSYRNLFGKLIHIYELQSIPGWDISTIRTILPFVVIRSDGKIEEDLVQRIRKADQYLLLRISSNQKQTTEFPGNNLNILARYRLQYKDLLSIGFTGEKDAGEQFFAGKQKGGFDFYSAHVFIKKAGVFETIALGDFTVNMGQGLIQSHSGGIGKGGDVTNIKQQSATIRPYTSAGEYLFCRGMGITMQRKKVSLTMFASSRRVSGTLEIDSALNTFSIKSINTSGYHRTASELSGRKSISQFFAGSTVQYNSGALKSSVNFVYSAYPSWFSEKTEPYQYYSIKSKNWFNASIDYNTTLKNIHMFGETAIDMFCTIATLNGAMISLDHHVDLTILARFISPKYQTHQGNAFTENSKPTNEYGLFTGLTIKPFSSLRIDMYADLFRFPWLKYRVNSPGIGKDLMIQLIYTASKTAHIQSRFRIKQKEINHSALGFPVEIKQTNWRTHVEFEINKTITLRNRIEFVIHQSKGEQPSHGFLAYVDLLYRPLLKPYSCGVRFLSVDADNYDARIYAFENDVLHSYSILPFHQKGYRIYLNLHYEFSGIQLWSKVAYNVAQNNNQANSSEVNSIHNDGFEWRFQLKILF